MFRVAVIGCGYWGPNLIRNFRDHHEVEVKIICDLDPERLKIASNLVPGVELTTDSEVVFQAKDIDIVAIATPVNQHYDLALKALNTGKHVLVEKPFTKTSEEAVELIQLAERKDLTLMVDHTFLFTGAVRMMKEIIQSGELGEIYYFDSVRINLGLFQHDVNVVWDLAPHDFSIMQYLLEQPPTSIQVISRSHVGQGTHQNMDDVGVGFDNSRLAHIHVNWMAPVKIRRTIIGGSKKMLVYDDLEREDKIKIYDRGVEVTTRDERYSTLIQYRTGDVHVPKLNNTEALKREVTHLIDCIKMGKKPDTDGVNGLDVVQLLEASDRSILLGGQEVEILDMKREWK